MSDPDSNKMVLVLNHVVMFETLRQLRLLLTLDRFLGGVTIIVSASGQSVLLVGCDHESGTTNEDN